MFLTSYVEHIKRTHVESIKSSMKADVLLESKVSWGGTSLKLSNYLAHVKNLRGVIYGSGSTKSVINRVKWLKQRFRYRNLAVPTQLIKNYPEVQPLIKEPLLRFTYPLPEVFSVAEVLAELTGDYGLAESVVLASSLISPVIAVGDDVVGRLRRLYIGEVLTGKELSVQDYKLHMRIADYSVLDMYIEMVTLSEEVLKDPGKLSDVIKVREERVREDIKRYWRISGGEGRPVVMYLDPLKVLGVEGIRRLKSLGDLERVSIALSLVTAVIVYV